MSWFLIGSIIVVSLVYTFIVFQVRNDWSSSETKDLQSGNVSVVVAMRNEAQNLKALFNSFQSLTYPKDKYEIILVDDHSEDTSLSLSHEFANKVNLPIKVLKLEGKLSGKKNALELGIKHAQFENILVTDADCEVASNWIESMQPNTAWDFVSGPVVYKKSDKWFSTLLMFDLAALIALGASRIKQGSPVLANGANMMFKKSAFESVGGFSGNIHMASGDDVFLLKKHREQRW